MNNDQNKKLNKTCMTMKIMKVIKFEASVAMLMKKSKTKHANAHNRCYSANDSVIRQMMKIITQKKNDTKKSNNNINNSGSFLNFFLCYSLPLYLVLFPFFSCFFFFICLCIDCCCNFFSIH